ncbi:hypothetical protein ACHAXS_010190 [Conticribra weissflogii]
MHGVMNSIFQGVDVDLRWSTVVANGNGIERRNNGRGKGKGIGKVNNRKGNVKGKEQQHTNRQLANVTVSSTSTCCGGTSDKADNNDAGCACKSSNDNGNPDNVGCCSRTTKTTTSATMMTLPPTPPPKMTRTTMTMTKTTTIGILDVEDMGKVIQSRTKTTTASHHPPKLPRQWSLPNKPKPSKEESTGSLASTPPSNSADG